MGALGYGDPLKNALLETLIFEQSLRIFVWRVRSRVPPWKMNITNRCSLGCIRLAPRVRVSFSKLCMDTFAVGFSFRGSSLATLRFGTSTSELPLVALHFGTQGAALLIIDWESSLGDLRGRTFRRKYHIPPEGAG